MRMTMRQSMAIDRFCKKNGTNTKSQIDEKVGKSKLSNEQIALLQSKGQLLDRLYGKKKVDD